MSKSALTTKTPRVRNNAGPARLALVQAQTEAVQARARRTKWDEFLSWLREERVALTGEQIIHAADASRVAVDVAERNVTQAREALARARGGAR